MVIASFISFKVVPHSHEQLWNFLLRKEYEARSDWLLLMINVHPFLIFVCLFFSFHLQALEKMQESDSCVFSTKDASLNPSKNRYRDVLPCNYLPLRLFLYLKSKFDRCKINLLLNKQRSSYTETITRIRTNDVSVSSWRHFQI